MATVKNIVIANGKLVCYLEFYNETWIDSKGEEQEVSGKHYYMFSMNDVKKV